MEFLTNMVVTWITYFEGVWIGVFPSMANAGTVATVYAVIAIISILSAVIGLVMVVSRRADGLAVKGGIIQALFVVIFPAVYSAMTA